eukprot:TRINITY_DN211_c2_g1_i2.p1 TRINITY_DN211_c2_g1~~TRINITY_DN211_c2_g1_i2.p1  ORF type:complete len:1259 (+),score=414.62 TRINITY_DN211_c2_g1_i2:69-3845(+)
MPSPRRSRVLRSLALERCNSPPAAAAKRRRTEGPDRGARLRARSTTGAAPPRSSAPGPPPKQPRPQPSGRSAAPSAASESQPEGRRERVKVVVRKRPLNAREKGEADLFTEGERTIACEGHEFEFSRVLGPEASNADVFHTAASSIARHATNGWNGTVFAYGQTSSGKTHTMMGSAESPGIVPLALQQLFDDIAQCRLAKYGVTCLCFEIYNEVIRDLTSGEAVQAFMSDGRLQLKGCSEHEVTSPGEANEILREALQRRHVAATERNEQSSRSHTIFQVQIARVPWDHNQSRTCSVLNLVDLAGSESIKKTKATGSTAREGKAINVSLSALVRVIDILSTGRKGQHVPFRDSNLTRILEPSLGGNTRTAVVCCVTGAAAELENTLSTLRFAQSASRIQNKPKRNSTEGALEPSLQAKVDQLAAARIEDERAELRAQVAALARDAASARAERGALAPDKERAQGAVLAEARLLRFLESRRGPRPDFDPPPRRGRRRHTVGAPLRPRPWGPADEAGGEASPRTLAGFPAPRQRESEGRRAERSALAVSIGVAEHSLAKARARLGSIGRSRTRAEAEYRLRADSLIETCEQGQRAAAAAEAAEQRRDELWEQVEEVREAAEAKRRKHAVDHNSCQVRCRELEDEEEELAAARKRARLAEDETPALREQLQQWRLELERSRDPPPVWNPAEADRRFAESEAEFAGKAERSIAAAEAQLQEVLAAARSVEEEVPQLQATAEQEERGARREREELLEELAVKGRQRQEAHRDELAQLAVDCDEKRGALQRELSEARRERSAAAAALQAANEAGVQDREQCVARIAAELRREAEESAAAAEAAISRLTREIADAEAEGAAQLSHDESEATEALSKRREDLRLELEAAGAGQRAARSAREDAREAERERLEAERSSGQLRLSAAADHFSMQLDALAQGTAAAQHLFAAHKDILAAMGDLCERRAEGMRQVRLLGEECASRSQRAQQQLAEARSAAEARVAAAADRVGALAQRRRDLDGDLEVKVAQNKADRSAECAALRGELQRLDAEAQDEAARRSRKRARLAEDTLHDFEAAEPELRARIAGACSKGAAAAAAARDEQAAQFTELQGKRRRLSVQLRETEEETERFAPAAAAELERLAADIPLAAERERAAQAEQLRQLGASAVAQEGALDESRAESSAQLHAELGWTGAYMDALTDQRRAAALITQEEMGFAKLRRQIEDDEDEIKRLTKNAERIEKDNRRKEVTATAAAQRQRGTAVRRAP